MSPNFVRYFLVYLATLNLIDLFYTRYAILNNLAVEMNPLVGDNATSWYFIVLKVALSVFLDLAAVFGNPYKYSDLLIGLLMSACMWYTAVCVLHVSYFGIPF